MNGFVSLFTEKSILTNSANKSAAKQQIKVS